MSLRRRLKPAERQRAPKNPFRRFAYWLTINNAFEYFMVSVVAVNTVCLAMVHYDMSPRFTLILEQVSVRPGRCC
jgi:hypothetical protein